MNELTLKETLDAYTKELIPTVLEMLELAGCSDKLCATIKASIWNQKDASLNKLIEIRRKKESNNDYQKNYRN